MSYNPKYYQRNREAILSSQKRYRAKKKAFQVWLQSLSKNQFKSFLMPHFIASTKPSPPQNVIKVVEYYKDRSHSSSRNVFSKKYTPSPELAAILKSTLPTNRPEAVRLLWTYIKNNKLQDTKERRNINCDQALKQVMGQKDVVSMFELAKHLDKHLL